MEERFSRGLRLHLRAHFHPGGSKAIFECALGGGNSQRCSVLNLDSLLLKGYSAKGATIGHSMEDIAEIARQMIVETEMHPPSQGGAFDPGFLASFWLYPKADALA